MGFLPKDITEVGDLQAALGEIGTKKFDLAVVDMYLSKSEDAAQGLIVIKRMKMKDSTCRVAGISSASAFRTLSVDATVAGADEFIATENIDVNWVSLLRTTLERWRGARLREQSSWLSI